METVTIHSLRGETPQMKSRLRGAQMESARLWNDVKEFHVFRRTTNGEWSTQDDLQKHIKGRYALHSQSIQMVCHQLLANVDATDERRRNAGCFAVSHRVGSAFRWANLTIARPCCQ